MWTVAVSTWDVAASAWDVVGTMWSIAASVWDAPGEERERRQGTKAGNQDREPRQRTNAGNQEREPDEEQRQRQMKERKNLYPVSAFEKKLKKLTNFRAVSEKFIRLPRNVYPVSETAVSTIYVDPREQNPFRKEMASPFFH